jgi:hypothetical protein
MCALALVAACAPEPETPAPADIRAARSAAFDFDQRMARDIVARLDRGEDPVAVWLAYADHAPDWGRQISNAAEIDFSRTALGVRNPANAPDDWERRQMEQMSFMLDTGLDPETLEVSAIVLEDGLRVFRWMRPVLMGEPCLACHGEAIDPRIRLLIGQEYPLDEATGYAAQQFGGAYSARRVLGAKGENAPPWRPIPPPDMAPADVRATDDAPLVTPSTP